MTDFNKVKEYYKNFDEKNRLVSDNSGKLEFEMTMRILKSYLKDGSTILDLGGASGVYSLPLAETGYKVTLADLSEKLIEEAREASNGKLVSCDVVNAIDLSIYEDSSFDVVLLFGPLYHLLESDERSLCIREVARVLKSGGLVFASYIPFLSGATAIVDRYFRHKEQVDIENLTRVFEEGKFNNASKGGFQEGYYPRTSEVETLFKENGFDKILIRSIRSFGYEKEDLIYNIEDEEMFKCIMDLIDKTSIEESIIETCGHAMYIGSKKF